MRACVRCWLAEHEAVLGVEIAHVQLMVDSTYKLRSTLSFHLYLGKLFLQFHLLLLLLRAVAFYLFLLLWLALILNLLLNTTILTLNQNILITTWIFPREEPWMCLPFSIFIYHVLLWCRTLRLSKVNDIFETRLIYLLVIIVRLLLGNSLFKLHLVLLCCHYLVLLICQYGVLTGRLLGCCLHLALSGLGRSQNCSNELVLTIH